jgi:hypothetical protein
MKASAWFISSALQWKRSGNSTQNVNHFHSNGNNLSLESGLILEIDKNGSKQQTDDHNAFDGDVCDIRQSPHRLLKVWIDFLKLRFGQNLCYT